MSKCGDVQREHRFDMLLRSIRFKDTLRKEPCKVVISSLVRLTSLFVLRMERCECGVFRQQMRRLSGSGCFVWDACGEEGDPFVQFFFKARREQSNEGRRVLIGLPCL